jgi:hypothetical protein
MGKEKKYMVNCKLKFNLLKKQFWLRQNCFFYSFNLYLKKKLLNLKITLNFNNHGICIRSRTCKKHCKPDRSDMSSKMSRPKKSLHIYT